VREWARSFEEARPYGVCLLTFFLMPLCSLSLAQVGTGKRSAAPSRLAHLMVTPDSLKWEPLPAAMFRGTPPVDTTSSWRYARLKGDPLKRARRTRLKSCAPTAPRRHLTGIHWRKTLSW
jgi:hypothetical protein